MESRQTLLLHRIGFIPYALATLVLFSILSYIIWFNLGYSIYIQGILSLICIFGFAIVYSDLWILEEQTRDIPY